MVGTGAALLLVNVLIWGPQTWLAWLQSLWAFSNVAAQDGIRRVLVSMPGQASFYGLPALPAQVIAIGIAALFAMRQPIKDHAALIVGCSIFASPYAMPYDLVALAPWAAERLLRDRLGWHSIASALIYLGVIFPLAWLVTLSVRWRTALIVDDSTCRN
jgi:hypothetical protein